MTEAVLCLIPLAILAVVVWRTHQFPKPIRIGRRAQLSMTVRDGRIHFRSKPDER